MIEFATPTFDEAIKTFKDKTALTPDKYRLLTDEARAKAFTVSGITRMDIMGDFYNAMDKAISEKTTFADFKKSVKEAEALRGWGGEQPYRLDTVFRTNVQSAFQAGHYQQLMRTTQTRPYWQYVAVMDGRTRPLHAAMNGKVAPHDDPFWTRNFPPNGFNCRCTVVSVSKSELDRDGLKVENDLPDIADAGFKNNPGEGMGRMLTGEQFERLKGDPARWTPLIQETFDNYGRESAKTVSDYILSNTALWPKGEKAVELYKANLMGKTLKDVVGDPLILNDEFINHLKIDGRERYLPLIEEVVKSPYEIWLQAEKENETGKVVLRKRYVSFVETGRNHRLIVLMPSRTHRCFEQMFGTLTVL
jgi:SPP1 gp7 family putative phage head morphogenesis protein